MWHISDNPKSRLKVHSPLKVEPLMLETLTHVLKYHNNIMT